MKIPESMKEELGKWNDGKGISLDSWIGCTGNISLAVGYCSIFCPEFFEFDGYIFHGDGLSQEGISNLRDFEREIGSNPKSIEALFNSFRIYGIHASEGDELTADKVIHLGETLKALYQARLAYLFPDKPCIVEFYRPDDEDEIDEYQLTFWQKKNENR